MLSNSNTQEQKLIQAIELSEAEMEKVSGGDRDLESETWERTRSRRYTRDDDEVEDDDQLAFYEIDRLVNSMNTITVRANYFKANKYGKHYALSDSGADSTVVGSMAHVVGYTGRFATLVGYKPDSTATPLVPIATVMVLAQSHTGIPVILKIHEAPYIESNPIMLISEYQVREYGLVIDSTSKRHKAPNGQYGTQRFNISEDVHIPFVDRGGLMGFEVLHWEKDAVEKYEVFEITQDSLWRPQVFMELEDPQLANLAYSASDIAQIMSGDMGGHPVVKGRQKIAI